MDRLKPAESRLLVSLRLATIEITQLAPNSRPWAAVCRELGQYQQQRSAGRKP